MSKNLCVYHSGCIDGYGSAWAVYNYFKVREGCDFYKGIYNKTSPDVKGKDVYLVDFSYRRAVVEEMLLTANSVTIIDHHKSAIDDLLPLVELRNPKLNLYFSLDNSNSGCVLTWRFFFQDRMDQPQLETPMLLKYIEDRDLWRFHMAHTKKITAALYSYDFDFDLWDSFADGDQTDLIEEGKTLLRQQDKAVKQAVKHVRFIDIGENFVPLVNCPASISSEVGHELAKDLDSFSATYWDSSDCRVFSLRSADHGMDVSKIAFSFGGGGHKHAAGFKIPFSDLYRLGLL